MASAILRSELECSVCLGVYTDPVNLTCGHNFCRECIDCVLDTQKGSGGYSCPECREAFLERPSLYRNIALRKILDNILSSQSDKELEILCTYCVDSPVLAVKSCLHCEASLCDKHLKAHHKSPEHVLCDPIADPRTKKCSVHKKLLEYYCTQDSACICVLCRIDGAHQGHSVQGLGEASENKKKELNNILQKMLRMKEETEQRVQILLDHRRKSEEKADAERERYRLLFEDLRRLLEDLEKRVQSEISKESEGVSLSVNNQIRELEIKKDELSRKIRHIEEICNMADPLAVLQKSDRGDFSKSKKRKDKQLQDLDFARISHIFHDELSKIIPEVAKKVPVYPAKPWKEMTITDEDHTWDLLHGLAGAHPWLNLPHSVHLPHSTEESSSETSSEESALGWRHSHERKNLWLESMKKDDSDEEEAKEEFGLEEAESGEEEAEEEESEETEEQFDEDEAEEDEAGEEEAEEEESEETEEEFDEDEAKEAEAGEEEVEEEESEETEEEFDEDEAEEVEAGEEEAEKEESEEEDSEETEEQSDEASEEEEYSKEEESDNAEETSSDE